MAREYKARGRFVVALAALVALTHCGGSVDGEERPELLSERVAEAAGDCPGGVTLTPISAIQGPGVSSPLTGRTVITEGVVTGDYQPAEPRSGFFIQDAEGDGNPATSEGLFVFVPRSNPLSGVDVKPGDRVRVSGTVKELRTGSGTLTELDTLTGLDICSSGAVLAPTPVALPVRAVTDLEAYEGMLVTFAQQLTVTETCRGLPLVRPPHGSRVLRP